MQIGQRRDQDGLKRAIKSFKTQKPAFAKTYKNLQFFKVFGVPGYSILLQKAQDGSQKAPNELQHLKKKESQNGPQNYVFLGKIMRRFGGSFSAQNWLQNLSKSGPKK